MLPLDRLSTNSLRFTYVQRGFSIPRNKTLLEVSHCDPVGPDSTLHILSLVVRLMRRSFRPPHQSEDQVDCSPCGCHMVSQLCQKLCIFQGLAEYCLPGSPARCPKRRQRLSPKDTDQDALRRIGVTASLPAPHHPDSLSVISDLP
jgi:hypothetical protein